MNLFYVQFRGWPICFSSRQEVKWTNMLREKIMHKKFNWPADPHPSVNYIPFEPEPGPQVLVEASILPFTFNMIGTRNCRTEEAKFSKCRHERLGVSMVRGKTAVWIENLDRAITPAHQLFSTECIWDMQAVIVMNSSSRVRRRYRRRRKLRCTRNTKLNNYLSTN